MDTITYGLYSSIFLIKSLSRPYLTGQYAIVIAISQVLGKKLDIAVFKLTVAIGIPMVIFMEYHTGSLMQGSWPLLGMMMPALGQWLYEVHDESPFLMSLPIPNWFWHSLTTQ